MDARIIDSVGETSYEFYSNTRKCPVHNQIHWFLMEADGDKYSVNKMEDFTDGGFFPIDEALEKITYSQDKSLVSLAYRKYQEYLTEKGDA